MNKSNRSGFTLVELIFVIVIIGVLAAVAVPKFAGLKQNAEAASVIKVASDAYASIPSAYVNQVDLEGKTITKISELVDISGKGWSVDTTDDKIMYFTDLASGTNTVGTDDVVTLTLGDRNITLAIDCTNFIDTKTQTKCTDKAGSSTSSIVTSF